MTQKLLPQPANTDESVLPICQFGTDTINNDILCKLSNHTAFIAEVREIAEKDTASQKPMLERIEQVLNARQKRSKFAQAISELTDQELEQLTVILANPRLISALKNYYKTPHHGVQYYTLAKELSDRNLIIKK